MNFLYLKKRIVVNIDEKLLKAVPKLRLFTGTKREIIYKHLIPSFLLFFVLFSLGTLTNLNHILRICLIILGNLYLFYGVYDSLKTMKNFYEYRNEEAKSSLIEFQKELPLISSFYSIVNKNTLSITIKYFKNEMLLATSLDTLSEEEISFISGLIYCANILKDSSPHLIKEAQNEDVAILWSYKDEQWSFLMLDKNNEPIHKEIFDLASFKFTTKN